MPSTKNRENPRGFRFSVVQVQKTTKKTQIERPSNQTHLLIRIPRGLMARILGFHPRGPGSIPGVGEHFIFIFTACLFLIILSNFFSWPYWKSLMYKRVKLKLCTFYKLPKVYIQSNITPFIAREVCQIIPDTPLVIAPPLCNVVVSANCSSRP